ncbi:hypothetical protein T265_15556, partial [Opisthorchis viverrini]
MSPTSASRLGNAEGQWREIRSKSWLMVGHHFTDDVAKRFLDDAAKLKEAENWMDWPNTLMNDIIRWFRLGSLVKIKS